MADAATPTAWRTRPADATRPRRRLLAILLVALAAVTGTILGLVLWLSPPKPVALAPIWITTEPAASGIPGVVPWTAQDRSAFLEGQLLGKPVDDSSANPSRDQIRLRLKALSNRKPTEPVVVFLSAPANVDNAGEVYLLGADPVGDHPRNRIALTEVLELFRTCPAEHRLVVLDLWPMSHVDVTAPPAGMISTAAAAALEAVADDRRLCLLSCDAGQVPLASPVLGRTLFGHYAEAGLQGAADGWNEAGTRDGRVSVAELAAYTRSHAIRWSQAANVTTQTPRLLGAASDFTLHPATRDEAIAFFDRPAASLGAYPDWLKAAWAEQKPGESLLRAEQAWASGKPSAEVQREFEKAIRDERTGAKGPTPSLASLPATIRDSKLEEELKVALVKAETKPPAVPPVPGLWPELEPFKTRPHDATAAAAFAFLQQEPVLSLVRLRQLDLLLTAQSATPRFAETRLLHRLAELNDPVRVALLLRLGSEFEQASIVPAVVARATPALDEVYRRWIAAQAAVFSPGYISANETEQRLAAAAAAIRQVKAFADATHVAHATLRNAQNALRSAYPAFLAAVVSLPSAANLADSAQRLTATFDVKGDPLTLETITAAVDVMQQQTSAVGSALATFARPFSASALSSLRDRAVASDATSATAAELAAVLRTPLVPASDRPRLWEAYLALEKRFSDDVTRLDRDEVVNGITKDYRNPREPAATGERIPDSIDRQVEWAGLELLARNRSLADIPGTTPAAKLARIRASAPIEPRQPASVGSPVWKWQAARFEYESHDPVAAGSSAFAAEAARTTRAAAGSTGTVPYLDFTSSVSPLYGERAGSVVEVGTRLIGGTSGEKAKLKALTRFPDWLSSVAPDEVELSPAREVPVRFSVVTKDAPPGNGAEGVILEATVDGRTFHHRIPMNLDAVANRLQLVITNDPKAAPRAMKELLLRPHGQTMPYFLYLSNPGPNSRALVVRLVTLGVETKGFALAPRDMAPLQFPAPQAPPAAPGQPTAEVPGLRDLTQPLVFEVLEGESRKLVQTIELPVTLLDPGRYLTVTDVVYRPAIGGRPNGLSVRLRSENPLDNPPCPVEMVLPAEANPGLMIRDGKLKGTLPTDGSPLRLYADGLTTGGVPPNRLYVNLTTDGSERAFTFAGTVPAEGETVRLTPVTEPLVRVRAAEFASGIKPLPVRVEVDNAPDASHLELRLGTYVGDRFVADSEKKIDTPRERSTAIGLRTPDGALLLKGVLRDWATTLPVDFLVGLRDLEARLVSEDGKVLAESRVKVMFDSAPPTNIEFLSLPPKVAKEKPLAVRATSDKPVSGVKEVKFFVGKPVKGEAPQGVPTVVGKLVDAQSNVWEAVLPPTAVDGPITVTALFTSRAGLTGAGSQETESMAGAEANKPEPATISGKVIEGRLPQADLVVVLSDEKGPKGQVKTKADGSFQFSDVPPGKYKLHVEKESTNRKADQDVDVKAGETKTVTLELLL